MKQLSFAVAISIVLVAFPSCGDEQHHDAGGPAGELRLDDGEAWEANEATHMGMAQMRQMLVEFEDSDEKDYVALGEALREEANRVVQKCTMTGEAHEQLHLVLTPMLEVIGKLTSGEGGAEQVAALRGHLDDYDAHFRH